MNLFKKIIGKARRYNWSPYWFLYQVILRSAMAIAKIKYFFLRKQRIKNGELSVKLDNGNIMYLDPIDKGLSRDVIIDVNREKLSQTILGELKEGDVVIDLGSNLGYYALKECKLIGSKGIVYAIEPVSRNVQLLKKNLNVNNYSNFEVHCLAIGDHEGEAEIHVGSNLNLSNILGNSTGEGDTKIEKVPMRTLKSFILENDIKPNFLRMDVEGYEYEIINSSINILADYDIKIMLEFHSRLLGKERSLELLKTLKNVGYESKIVVFDNPFYPYINLKSPLLKVTLYLYSKFRLFSRFNDEKNPSLLCGVHTNITIDDLMKNEDLIEGETMFIGLFEKRVGINNTRKMT